jgi:hypothetical protein
MKRTKVLVVPRGKNPDYYGCLQVFAEANEIRLIIDRRVRESRRGWVAVPVERRTRDRRRSLPSTWSEGEFVSVNDGDLE